MPNKLVKMTNEKENGSGKDGQKEIKRIIKESVNKNFKEVEEEGSEEDKPKEKDNIGEIQFISSGFSDLFTHNKSNTPTINPTNNISLEENVGDFIPERGESDNESQDLYSESGRENYLQEYSERSYELKEDTRRSQGMQDTSNPTLGREKSGGRETNFRTEEPSMRNIDEEDKDYQPEIESSQEKSRKRRLPFER